MQVIYIDILLLINFSMDFVALFLTARLMHARAKAIPLAAASLIGAGYEALRLFISWSLPLSVISDIACAVLMCVIALGASELLRTTLTFLCASIIIGGTMTALYSFAGMGDGLFSGSSAESTDALLELPFGRFIPAAALSAAFALLLCRTLRSRLGRKKCICRITVNGSSAELSGLYDSGNLLRDPLSGRPCILLTPASAAALLPPELCSGTPPDCIEPRSARMDSTDVGNTLPGVSEADTSTQQRITQHGGNIPQQSTAPQSTIPHRHTARHGRSDILTASCDALPEITAGHGRFKLRMIPMCTPTGSSLLTAVIPDSVTVGGRECRALIAVSPGRSDFGGADALVPASLM